MKEIKIIGSALPNIPWEDRPESSSVPLWRYSQNPIIKRNQLPEIGRASCRERVYVLV